MEFIDEMRNRYSFHDLKKEQMIVLQHLFQKQNVFALLLTGYGKSLIYTLFPLLKSKVHFLKVIQKVLKKIYILTRKID